MFSVQNLAPKRLRAHKTAALSLFGVEFTTKQATSTSNTNAFWRSWRETSGEHQNLYVDVDVDDNVRNTAGAEILEGDCWPSLGLGNAAGAEILEGDV